MLGYSRVGHRFVEVLTAEYEGRLLTTDVECELVSSEDNSVLGSNWLFAWREVWRSQLGSSSIPKCIAVSPASCTVSTVASTGRSDIASGPSLLDFGECRTLSSSDHMVRHSDVSKAAAMDVDMIQLQDDPEVLHDQIVDQLMALPKGVSLGDATYKDNFIKDTNVHTGNFSYKCPDSGAEYETVLTGEILPKACGTKLSAMGNHYLGPASSPNVITDKSCIKAVFAIGKPCDANVRMAITFDNQVVMLDDVIQQDIEELKRKNKDVTIKE
ncbi:hypothetical protein M405DRAFT_573347 [Rhizopogon salebrosus TDB-379]|nr:hypothetical protein M405DRAFT_573347 [Rhizopogon salebrosus TDB-379]